MKMTVKILPVNFNKMVAYAQAAYSQFKTEVSGYAPVYMQNDSKHMIVGEPVILNQECSAALTTLDKEAISEYIHTVAIQNKELLPDNLMFCWWHSHHIMKAYFSPTDEATINEYAENGSCLAIVVNNKGEYQSCFRKMVNIHGTQFPVNLEVELDFSSDNQFEGMEDEIKTLVRKKVYITGRAKSWDNINGMVQGNIFEKTDYLDEDSRGPISNDGMAYGYNEDTEAELYLETVKMQEEGRLQSEPPCVLPLDKPEKKPKKIKKVKKFSSMEKKFSDLNLTDKEETEKYIDNMMRNIDSMIEVWHLDTDGLLDEEKHLQEIISHLDHLKARTKLKLHVPSSLENITCFSDLEINENKGNYDESTYSEISKYL